MAESTGASVKEGARILRLIAITVAAQNLRPPNDWRGLARGGSCIGNHHVKLNIFVNLGVASASSSLSYAASWRNWCGLRKRSGQQTFSIIFWRNHYSIWAADDLHCNALLTRRRFVPDIQDLRVVQFCARDL